MTRQSRFSPNYNGGTKKEKSEYIEHPECYFWLKVIEDARLTNDTEWLESDECEQVERWIFEVMRPGRSER